MGNKRLWERDLNQASGSFVRTDRDIFGEMALNNYSRKGFQASLNMEVAPGSNLLFEINLPKKNMPIRTQGRVIWTKANSRDVDYKFDVGVELKEVDLLDINKVADKSYKNEYLEQVADYALELGIFTRKNQNSFFKTSCSNAAVFILFFMFGSIMTLINPFFAFFHASAVWMYIVLIIMKKRETILSDDSKRKVLFTRKRFLRIAGLMLCDICSGIYFLIGFFLGKHSLETDKNV